ncbi:MAG: manganese efflux pump, partial [Clostridia bacterium]|nr:manganese efflux pump [Clostridia bacterium]
MQLMDVLLLAVGLSMDAFAVSICKGLALKKITLKNAGIVGLWFGGFQALMPLLGYLVGSLFAGVIRAA